MSYALTIAQICGRYYVEKLYMTLKNASSVIVYTVLL